MQHRAVHSAKQCAAPSSVQPRALCSRGTARDLTNFELKTRGNDRHLSIVKLKARGNAGHNFKCHVLVNSVEEC